MDQAVRNLVDFAGCSPEEAVAAASSVPARLLGLRDRGQSGGRQPRRPRLVGRLRWRWWRRWLEGDFVYDRDGLGAMSLWAEIESQPEVLGRLAVSQVEPARPRSRIWMSGEEFSYVVMAARGSSDNAARYAQYLWGARNRLNVALAAPSLYGPYREPARICATPWSSGSPSPVSHPTCWRYWRKAIVRDGRRLPSPTRWTRRWPGSPTGIWIWPRARNWRWLPPSPTRPNCWRSVRCRPRWRTTPK